MRFFFVLLGAFLGYEGAKYLVSEGLISPSINEYYVYGFLIAIGIISGFGVAPFLSWVIKSILNKANKLVHKAPSSELALGAVGLAIGLLLAILITNFLPEIPTIGGYLPAFITFLLGFAGMSLGLRKRDDFSKVFGDSSKNHNDGVPKILDTSVIIDGRIADITKSGFIEGPILVPGFVLEELQHIADSSDVLKRNRGRRGLDILNRIQKEPYVSVEVYDKDFDDLTEVDSKLVKLAKLISGKVITNDYNLNKVCELQGVSVLNINELANAVKPVVLPGEELRVHVIKDGKEQGQGVAYLDDGTMIVVDGGRRFIGETIGVSVTSVLQTAAGRMIFAKPKAMEKAL